MLCSSSTRSGPSSARATLREDLTVRWQLALRTRSAHLPPLPVRAKVLPRRLLLQGAGVLVAAWFPLLGFGVAGLSPLSDGVVSRPAPPVERSAGADVAGAVSARKRGVDSTSDEPVPEASVAPLADGSAAGPPSLPGSELANRRPSRRRLKATPAGTVGSRGRAGWPSPSTPAGTVRSRQRAGWPPPPISRPPFGNPARTPRPRSTSKGRGVRLPAPSAGNRRPLLVRSWVRPPKPSPSP